MRAAFCAVSLVALAFLLLRGSRAGLAGDYVDPIGKITTQDEALYSNSAIRMATQGGWLTPKFMGRLALYRPPLLMWLSGVSARIAGVGRTALRFPAALACSLALGLVFLWAAELGSWQAGASAALLVAANHLWHVLGSVAMSDGLLVAFYTAAVFCLFYDPWLESRAALFGFAAAVAAAILTKSVAGLLPLGVLGLYWLAAPRKHRPHFRCVCLAGVLAVAFAAPWFLYQMVTHPQWFWTEHVRVEILGFGAGAPPQTSRENPVLFYAMRFAAVDPVLTALSLAALPGFVGALRKRAPDAVLLLVWLAALTAAVFGSRYRNISYLLPMVPALAVMSAVYSPLAGPRRGAWLLAFASVALVWKIAASTAPFGISFTRATVQRQAPALTDYCERERENELILVDPADNLYASLLPLPRLRYALVGSGAVNSGPYGMPFAEMGITISADQFNHIIQWEPVFRDKLREWDLDSGEPIGTLILASSADELVQLIQAHSASDFYMPQRYRTAVEPAAKATHELLDAGGHVFLLSRESHRRQGAPAWSCRL